MFVQGKTRIVRVCHRRYGKDIDTLSIVIALAHTRVGSYLYGFPEFGQAKSVLWEGIDNDGIPFFDRIPKELIALNKFGQPDINETELKVKFKCGSLLQLVGTDRFDKSIIGRNPVCFVGSEHPISNPQAWEMTRPILEANGGIAIFPFTPRGKNHGWRLFKTAQRLHDVPGSKWWLEHQDVLATAPFRPDGEGPKTRADVDHLVKEEDMDPNIAEQDYFLSFEGALAGAIFGEYATRAYDEERFTPVACDPGLPVHTYWDLGIRDNMTILFMQETPHQTRIIDFFEGQGKGLEFYAKVLKEKPYAYGSHYAPHDAEVRDLGSGFSRRDTMQSLGFNWRVLKRSPLQDGIDAVRRNFSRLWVDTRNCTPVIESMREYRRKWDSKNREYMKDPVHDVHSHRMDALRVWAMAGQIGRVGEETRKPLTAEMDYDPLAPSSTPEEEEESMVLV